MTIVLCAVGGYLVADENHIHRLIGAMLLVFGGYLATRPEGRS